MLQKVKHSLKNGASNNGGSIPASIDKDIRSLLLDTVPDPIAYINSRYEYSHFNKAFAALFDLTSSVIGSSIRTNETIGRLVFPQIEKAMKGIEIQYESEIATNSSCLFFTIIITPDIDETGNVNGCIILLRDIAQENEFHYGKLMESLPVALYTCNKEGRILSYNKAAAELWGREPEIGKDLWCGSWKIYQPDGITPLPLDECPMALTLKTGQPIKGEEIIVERPDGFRLNVLPNPMPLFGNNGKLTGAVNMLLDVTESKSNEQKLGWLAAIIHSSADAVISKTLEGIITSWNEAAERMFGYTADEIIGQSVTKLIPDDRLEEEPKILAQLKQGIRIEHFETKRITKDKKILDISLTISPIKNSNGKIIGVSKIARDITAQTRLNEMVRESEERLRMASESAQLGTWEFHPITKKLIWSDECKKIYGLAYDKEPTNEFVIEHTYADDRELVQEKVKNAMTYGKDNNFQLKYRIIRESDKQIRWLQVHGKVHFDDHKQPERFIGNMRDITEEKNAEQSIKDSEERLRMAVQSTKLGTWEYLPLTDSLTWSDECRKIYDVPASVKVNFEFFSNHIHPDDFDFTQTEIQNAMKPGSNGNYDIQYRILRYSDKQPRWIRAQGKVFFNQLDQPERFIGTVLDITEDKQQELELKNSVELFTTMADNVPVMIWMSGDDKFDDFFNKTWLEFTGRTLEEESNEGWLKNVHPEDVQRCIDNYNKSFSEKRGFYTEYRLKRHDGKYRWIADNSVPRYDTNGEFNGFISACIDIDEQQKFREKIMESELRLKTISNASPVGLWMTDINAQNTFVNDTWMEWTGGSLDQQLGDGWMNYVVDEDRDKAYNKFLKALAAKTNYRTEFRIKRADGELRWYLTEGSPYYDINGDFAGYAGSVTDITEIKKLEERKDDFIKMASHELKTPITSIKGYVQLLLTIYDELNEENFKTSKPTVKASLNTIAKQVSKLTRLISELLDLTRIESGKLELRKSAIDLGSLVEETVQDVRQTTSSHAIIVYNDLEENIYGDKDRIAQVLLNLLTNAIKYSPEADSVEVFVMEKNKKAVIRVVDHGIGIDKKDHRKIFERFYRVEGKSEQTYPGFGIGLFIAAEIIQRHNGSISVESTKGKGSVFSITLPIDQK